MATAKKTAKKTPDTTATVEVGQVKDLVPFAMPPIEFSVTDAVIAQIKEDVKTLPKIEGPEDKKNYAVVKSARARVGSLRASIEKERKDKKSGAIEYGRQLDAEAKQLTAILEEIENPLRDQVAAIDAIHEAEAAKVQAAKDAKAKERETALADVGITLSITEAPLFLYSMTDEDFAAKLDDATFAYNTQKEREAEKEAELNHLREQEAARQEKERKEQEAEKARVAEEGRKLREERAAFEEQQRQAREAEADKRLQEQAEQARKEGEERGRQAAEAKALRDREAEAELEAARQAREEREAAAKPDKDKLTAYIGKLRDVAQPEMATEDGKALLRKFNKALREAIAEILNPT